MFCHITENWRGRPPGEHEVVVNLIGGTTTQGGLAIRRSRAAAVRPGPPTYTYVWRCPRTSAWGDPTTCGRLRLRSLIERIPHTRRYRLTAEGLCIALACHRTETRV